MSEDSFAWARITFIAVGIAIASVFGVIFLGHTVGEMADRAYFMMSGAAIALFLRR